MPATGHQRQSYRGSPSRCTGLVLGLPDGDIIKVHRGCLETSYSLAAQFESRRHLHFNGHSMQARCSRNIRAFTAPVRNPQNLCGSVIEWPGMWNDPQRSSSTAARPETAGHRCLRSRREQLFRIFFFFCPGRRVRNSVALRVQTTGWRVMGNSRNSRFLERFHKAD